MAYKRWDELLGQYQTYYSTRSTQSPDSCSGNARLRLCSNGVLSDSAVYQYASCSVTGQPIASTSPQFPSGLRATCDASGTRVTLTWNATPRAVNYAVRVIPTGSPLLWVRRDGLASTTFYASTTPGINYSWWIFANPSPPSLGQYTLGDPYVCVATSSTSR